MAGHSMVRGGSQCEFAVDYKKGVGFTQTEWLTAVISAVDILMMSLCSVVNGKQHERCGFVFWLNVQFCVPYDTDVYFKKRLTVGR